MKTIANIQFTDKGILIEKSYNEDNSVFSPYKEELFTEDFLTIAKRLAKQRMADCYKKLHSNLNKATHITQDMIAWKGGRFNISVWESLEDILKLNDVRELNFLQTQQIIRSMLLHGDSWLYDYDENWEQANKGSIYCCEDFKNFITEHLVGFCFINKDNKDL